MSPPPRKASLRSVPISPLRREKSKSGDGFRLASFPEARDSATGTAEVIRIVIVEDHGVVRAGLKMLIESRSGLSVVGEAANGPDGLALVTSEQPDIVILDLDLGGQSSLDFLPQLALAAPAARVLILTGLTDPWLFREALCLGAAGLVLKDKAASDLLDAIEMVYAGHALLSGVTMTSLLAESSAKPRPSSPDAAPSLSVLSPRERDVARLVCDGLSNKEIARRLFISGTTVHHHLTSIFSKLGVPNRFALIVAVSRDGRPPTPARPSSRS
jgi:DNA-binding NarL/FixJ family response regulator